MELVVTQMYIPYLNEMARSLTTRHGKDEVETAEFTARFVGVYELSSRCSGPIRNLD